MVIILHKIKHIVTNILENIRVCTQRRIASIIKSYKSVGISKMSFINCIILPKKFWCFKSKKEMEIALVETQKEFMDGQSSEFFAETSTSFFSGKDYL